MGGFLRKHLFLLAIFMALNLTCISGTVISSTSGRVLSEMDNRVSDDTVRVDPFDGFKKYRGGYDITNKHYWSSTVFLGIPGYAIAVVWLVAGVGYGGFLVVWWTCGNGGKLHKKRSSCHKHCYLKPFLLAVFFTLLAVLGTGLVLGGNAKFHSRAKTIIDIIIDTADGASGTISDTTGAMREMSSSLGGVSETSDATGFLTSTSIRLEAQAANIERQASKNRRLIDKGLKIVYVVTTLTISLTLTAVVALLVLGVLRFKTSFQVAIAVCWILTAFCWMFFGIYFFLNNFAGDTCTALESFEHDPYNNSLSSLLPCDELLSARSVLNDVSAGIYDLVNQVNDNISTSYGNIVQICNPFSPPPMHEYQPWNCPSTSIRIGDIPNVFRLLVCPDNEGQACTGGIMVSANDYNRVEAYSLSIQRFLDVYPGMESLVECQPVRDAFSNILENHCSPLKQYSRMVWAALAFLSVVVMGEVLMWTISAHHDLYHHSLGGSVNAAETLEFGERQDEHTNSDGSKTSPANLY